MENKGINFDSYDLDGMQKLMDEHGDSVFPFDSMNENMEQVSISIANQPVFCINADFSTSLSPPILFWGTPYFHIFKPSKFKNHPSVKLKNNLTEILVNYP